MALHVFCYLGCGTSYRDLFWSVPVGKPSETKGTPGFNYRKLANVKCASVQRLTKPDLLHFL